MQHFVQHSDVVDTLAWTTRYATHKYKPFASGHNAQKQPTRGIPILLRSTFNNLSWKGVVFFNNLELNVLHKRKQTLGQESLERITCLDDVAQGLLAGTHVAESAVGTTNLCLCTSFGYLSSNTFLDALKFCGSNSWVFQHLGCTVTELGSFERTR